MISEKKVKIWKYLMWIFIFIFCATGIAEIVTITYILLKRYGIRFFVASLFIPLKTSYIVPILIIVATFVGWKGIINKRPLIIKLFSCLIFISTLLHMVYIVLIFIEKEDLGRTMTDILTEKFQVANSTEWWDVIQTEYECCGIHGPADYRNKLLAVPFSCCELESGSCGLVHTKGCLRPLIDILSEDCIFVCQSLLIILFCQLPGVFLAWILSNRLKEHLALVKPIKVIGRMESLQ